jgi:hypothetical protein
MVFASFVGWICRFILEILLAKRPVILFSVALVISLFEILGYLATYESKVTKPTTSKQGRGAHHHCPRNIFPAVLYREEYSLPTMIPWTSPRPW